ncbi:hypothetical protein RUND412_007548 [Rhizina undulata]
MFGLYPEIEDRDIHIDIDIITVHGLDGGPYKTWTAESGEFWLKAFLSGKIPNARILTYDYVYKSQFSSSNPIPNTEDFAVNLLGQLAKERRRKKRPIIFICHCFGGIVVKSALILAHAAREYSDLFKSIYGIVVAKEQAQKNFPNETALPLDETHESISKFSSPDNQNFLIVAGALRTMTEGAVKWQGRAAFRRQWWEKGVEMVADQGVNYAKYLLKHGKEDVWREILSQLIAVFHHFLEKDKRIEVKTLTDAALEIFLRAIARDEQNVAKIMAEYWVEECGKWEEADLINETMLLALEKAIDGERNLVVQYLAQLMVLIYRKLFDHKFEDTTDALTNRLNSYIDIIAHRVEIAHKSEYLSRFWAELCLAAMRFGTENVLDALKGLMVEKLKMTENTEDDAKRQVAEVTGRLVGKRSSGLEPAICFGKPG